MPARTIVQQGEACIGDSRVAFQLVRVAGRKHVHVLVDDEGRLSVRAPWRYSVALALEAVHEHRRWIANRIRAAEAARRQRPALMDGSVLPLLDERLQLNVRIDAQLSLLPQPANQAPAVAGARIEGIQGAAYRSGKRLCVELRTLSPESLRRILEAWFRQQAEQTLPESLYRFAGRLGLEPARVTIRAQRSRWGSCSTAGAISLNWRLVLLPKRLVDYVLVHELCHLRHMDHSRKFWDLVASLIPDYRDRRERLASMQPRLAL